LKKGFHKILNHSQLISYNEYFSKTSSGIAKEDESAVYNAPGCAPKNVHENQDFKGAKNGTTLNFSMQERIRG